MSAARASDTSSMATVAAAIPTLGTAIQRFEPPSRVSLRGWLLCKRLVIFAAVCVMFIWRPLVAVAVVAASSRLGPSPDIAAEGAAVQNGDVSKAHLQRGMVLAACIMFVVGAALAAAETAITTLWPWKVRELAEKEGEKSPFAIIEKDLTRFLTTILVATTSATVFSTAVATELAAELFGATSVAYVTAALTVFFLFFGEILPKTIAVHAPAKVVRLMTPVISLISTIVYPIGKILAFASTIILRLFKLPKESDAAVSEEELRLIVAGADRSGSIEKYESQIIKNVLDLEETPVRAVMCPRVDMVALDVTCTLTELLQEEAKSHYSRMPIYNASIDNIVGVVFAKSMLRYLNEDAVVLDNTNVAEIMDPAFFVPESMSVWIALEQMRKRRLHMAIVVDEYGGTAGLVTLEDILEEVVGEIYDEDDEIEAETQDIMESGEGSYIMDGQAELDKVGELLVMDLTEDDLRDYGTISGFLCARMGGIPQVGDQIIFDRIRFTVTDADDRRVRKVRSELLSEEEMEELRGAQNLDMESDDMFSSVIPGLSSSSVASGGDDDSRTNKVQNSGAVVLEPRKLESMQDSNGVDGPPNSTARRSDSQEFSSKNSSANEMAHGSDGSGSKKEESSIKRSPDSEDVLKS